ncbi:fungal-specific transcription factor domain-containing protein [Xylariaceae sp. FL0255]|nr:fungal-specific transcription factor domain-containing protein [Xylariaceae sp. FL0255]
MNNETPASAAESRTRRRRVPEEQRKRGVQSCDLCRKKRCKCILVAGTSQQCVNCLAQGAPCTYTLPRKTRLYGSVEDLSDRFRCLEALVQGAFPNEALGSVQELMELGQRRGYSMPTLSKENGPLVNPDVMLQNHVPSHTATGQNHQPDSALTEHAERDDISHALVRPSTWNMDHYTSPSDHASLVRDASGREHYIGAAGGLQFLGQLRRALLSRDQTSQTVFPIRPKAVSNFVEDDGAQALETDDLQAEKVEETDTTLTENMNHYSPSSVMTGSSDVTKKSTIDVDRHWKQLPSPDVMAKHLRSYFQNVHCNFPLFHQGTFEEEFEARLKRYQIRARNGVVPPQPCEDLDLGWIGCLQMMIAFGSMKSPISSKDDLDDVAMVHRCVSATKSMIPYFASKCSLNNIRALFLLSLFLHNNNERNATWNLIGTAVRIAFALGLHQDSTSVSFRPIEREVRKRVFCSLYNFEQFLANSLGRPSALSHPEVEVIAPREDLLGGGEVGDPSLLSYSLRLHRIMGEVTISQSINQDNLEKHIRSANSILKELKAWNDEVAGQQDFHIPSIKSESGLFNEADVNAMGFEDLKAMLRWQSSSKLRAMLLLRMDYHYIMVLNTRPFLLFLLSPNHQTEKGSISSDTLESEKTLADVCVKNASQLAQYMLLLDSFSLVNGVSGLEMFDFYWACMILCLATLRQRMVGGEESSCDVYMDLVTKLRRAAANVKQCGTMKRFTQLIGAFTEYINHGRRPKDNAGHIKNSTSDEGNEAESPAASIGSFNQVAANQPLGQDIIGNYYRPSGLTLLGDTIEGGVGMDTGFFGTSAWGTAFPDPSFMTPMMDFGNYENYPPHPGHNRRWQ